MDDSGTSGKLNRVHVSAQKGKSPFASVPLILLNKSLNRFGIYVLQAAQTFLVVAYAFAWCKAELPAKGGNKVAYVC